MLKRTVSLRRFFLAPTTYVLVEKIKFSVAHFCIPMSSLQYQCDVNTYCKGGSRNFRQRLGAQANKQLTTFFVVLVHNIFYRGCLLQSFPVFLDPRPQREADFLFHGKIWKLFFFQVGVANFPGVGFLMVIPLKTYSTCDFPGGPALLSP